MKRSCVLCSIALLLLGCGVSKSQSTGADSKSGSGWVSLAISTKENTFKAGESVLLSITVKNISTGDYCEGHYLETDEAELNGYDVDVRDSSGKAYSRKPILTRRLKRSRGMLCIKPGETLKESLSVDQVVDLSAPDVYQIQVDHIDRGNNTHVRSNSITVTVTP